MKKYILAVLVTAALTSSYLTYASIPACQLSLTGRTVLTYLKDRDSLILEIFRKCETPSAVRPGCNWFWTYSIWKNDRFIIEGCDDEYDGCGAQGPHDVLMPAISIYGPGHYWVDADIYKGRCNDRINAKWLDGTSTSFEIER